jgi:hypothetical protein
MSKIPQGEWNAIAARYQNGESISRIARSYGCTPPAIHYILKRYRLRPVDAAPQPMQQTMQVRPSGAAENRLIRAHPPDPAPAIAPLSENSGNGAAGSRLLRTAAGPAAGFHVAAPPAPVERAVTLPISSAVGKPAGSASPPPALPGLDDELHLRAETAIESFRSSFDAALAEGSPGVCERLRQAATDLMRVAARTTIVLDRLNALAERSARAHNYPRSAHANDDFGKFG